MFRTLGQKNSSISLLLFSQTLLFAVPGTILGFLVMVLLLSGLEVILFSLTGVQLNSEVDSTTFWMAIALGICVPLCSNAGPIIRAIGKQLRDAMDTNRKIIDQVTV